MGVANLFQKRNQILLILYNLLIKIFGALIWVSQPFVPKAKKWLAGRKDLWQTISQCRSIRQPKIWVHCSSLGEFEQGRPVIEYIKKQYPQNAIILTFFSPSGYDIKKTFPKVDRVFYIPLDTQKNAEKFVELISPDLAIFVKYDFWFNHLKALNKKNIPFIFISSVFTKDHFLFKRWAQPLFTIFSQTHQIFVQDQKSLDLLTDRSCPATLAGDTRIDSVIQLQHQLKEYPLLKKIINNRQVLIFGSIWPEDLLKIQSWINDHLSHPQYCFLIAPHEVSDTMIGKIKSAIHTPAVRFSQLEDSMQEESVIIIDTIGDLAHLYPLSDVAYVGGGFGKSIHSILEPAAARVPVIFGPKHEKFKEADDLIACGGAISIQNEIAFKTAVEYFLKKENRREAEKGTKKFLSRHQGATTQIVDYLLSHKFI